MATAPKGTGTRKTRSEVGKEFKDISASAASAPPIPATERALKREKDDATRKAVEGISVDTVVQKVTTVGLEATRALSAVSEKLIEQTRQLEEVSAAVVLKEEELTRLHGVDVIKTELSFLVAEHDEKAKALEIEIFNARSEWADETAQRAKALLAQSEELNKNRQREEVDFKYARDLQRKKESDAWTEQLRVTAASERDRKEANEKSWQEREKALQMQEAEVAELRKTVAEIPALIKKETDRAVAIATSAQKSDLEHKHVIEKMGLDTQIKMADQATKNLVAEGLKKDNTIASLEARVAEALGKIESIANAALNSASGARTLAEVQTFLNNKTENGQASRKQ